MAGDDHFGPKRQMFTKLLIEIFVLLANENRKPEGFYSCQWERALAIQVEVESWEKVIDFIRQEKFRGYKLDSLPSPTRYTKEPFQILKRLKRLNLAEFDENELSQQGSKSGGLSFKLTNLPSRSISECHTEFENRLKSYNPKAKDSSTTPSATEAPPTNIYSPQLPDIEENFSTVPRSLSIKFVGRTETLKLLHENLNSLPEHKFLAVVAMGGQGKTELCIQYGLEHIEDYKGGICWISAREGDVAGQIISFARKVGYDIERKNLTDEEMLEIVWNNWRDESTLFIYDDVVELNQKLLPPPLKRFKVLITTRDRELGLNVENFPLGELPMPDALELFKELITPDRLSREPGFGKELMTFVDRLPLGIELLGGYLRSDLNLVMSLEEILKFLQDKRSTWSVIATDVFSPDESPLRTNQRNINECFDLSWVQLEPSDRKIANFVATLHRKRANSRFITSILTETASDLNAPEYSPKSQAKAFKKLVRYSLIKYLIKNSVYYYSYHLLLRDFVRNKMPQDERERWGGVLQT